MVERFLTLRREFDEAMSNFVLGVQWKKKNFSGTLCRKDLYLCQRDNTRWKDRLMVCYFIKNHLIDLIKNLPWACDSILTYTIKT